MDNSPVALETDPWPLSPSLEDPWSGEPVVNLASPPRKVDPPPAPEPIQARRARPRLPETPFHNSNTSSARP